jgi:hypothetical protein
VHRDYVETQEPLQAGDRIPVTIQGIVGST